MFNKQARRFAKPLALYLKYDPTRPFRARASDITVETNNSVRRIGRLVFWLMISGLCMLLSVPLYGSMLLFVFIPANHSSIVIAPCIGYVFARIGVSYAEVKSKATLA